MARKVLRDSPLDPSPRATRLKPKLLHLPIVSSARPSDSNYQLRQDQSVARLLECIRSAK